VEHIFASSEEMTTYIKPDEQKLKQLILYLADRCSEDPSFGRVKLNKLLYFIDLFAYGEFGQPVTGVEYMKQEQGPVPRRMVPVREEMLRDQWIAESKKEYAGLANPQIRIFPLRQADLLSFTPQEIAHIDKIIGFCTQATGTRLSDLTHQWLGWKVATKGETIPYETVFLSDDQRPTQYEIAHAGELIEQYGWDV
jgi:hypothetical protein